MHSFLCDTNRIARETVCFFFVESFFDTFESVQVQYSKERKMKNEQEKRKKMDDHGSGMFGRFCNMDRFDTEG